MMKSLLTRDDLAAMVGRVVKFTPDIVNWEEYAEPGMRARVLKFSMHCMGGLNDDPEDSVHKVYLDFSEFEGENHKRQQANYYDGDGVACLTALEAGWYEPQDWIYIGATTDVVPFKVEDDQ